MSSWIVFGGEDQRQFLMASRSQNRRAARTTTNIVVRNGPAATQGGGGQSRQQQQQRRRRRRTRPQAQIVRVLPNKTQGRRRGARLPRFNNRVVVQKIVTTLGTVGSNGSGSVETEMAVLLNPSTMKEATGSNSYGPLQVYASTYTLFSMRSLRLHLKPLVGSSAVSGTAVRMSWNPTSSPTQTSWSALGARKHSDATPGKDGRFTLTARDLRGPKDGWYKTNTKGDPMLSFAGSLEIHTLGETRSTYQNGRFEGGLFLAELETVWAFKDYSQQPGLMNLIKGESTGDATITTDNTGKLILTTPGTSALARAASTTTASEIIWMVTDAIIQAGASAFPQPFGWLIRGGWWFLKRVAGAPVRAGSEQFEIYASINDARASVPCIANTANAQPINIGQLHFQQVTPGNTGISTDIPQVRDLGDPFYAMDQVFTPTSSRRLKFNTRDQYVPGFDVWYHIQDGTQNPQTGVAFVADGVIRASFNIIEVFFDTPPSVDLFRHKIPIYIRVNGNGNGVLSGVAVAHTTSTLQNNTTWRVDTFLVHATRSEGASFTQNWKGSQMKYPVDDTYNAQFITPTNSASGFVRAQFEQGGWYAVQYTCYSTSAYPIARHFVCGGEVVGVEPAQPIHSGTQTFPVMGFDGDSSVVPVYGAGFAFKPFRDGEINVANGPVPQTAYTTLPAGEAEGYDDDPADEDDDFADPEDEDDGLTDRDLELHPSDGYDVPPLSRCVVHLDVRDVYESLLKTHPERDARLAVNQLKPSDEYSKFTRLYHDALVDGLSPRSARAYAMGL
ncbi:capsid protein precursor [Bovine astrovirus B170/HK]|uniref:capsid protein precursor n=1 Tax=Bovine astrovirus B170/HK TaxID=1027244 RepID=UPI00020CD905|nr:capsid protein precursor [Bovine astrovirus B170/HK]AED89603.1 capsid protein precursor [Bovine astrovirus B170/HK]